jgi:hypothetical protein
MKTRLGAPQAVECGGAPPLSRGELVCKPLPASSGARLPKRQRTAALHSLRRPDFHLATLTVGFVLAAILVARPARAEDPRADAWQWAPSPVPRALVVEGLWSDYFRWEPAMHEAGLLYQQAYVSRSPYFQPYTRLYHAPGREELQRYSVIVIANLDAPALTPERLKVFREFVEQGGGMLVLGGEWAYSRGAYGGTPLEEMLPVTFPDEHRIQPAPAGLPLSAAPQATWKPPFDFTKKPSAFFVQSLVAKPGSTVQLLAGDKPALVSGVFGKGRVVACALTATGEPPPGALPFWDWPDWPKLLGEAIDWAAGARPVVAAAPASTKPVLTEDEMNSLTLGSGVTPDMARRICERPTPATAEALLAHVLRPEGGGKVDLAGVYAALLPFARFEWGGKLRESLEKFSPDLQGRQAALVLLGASRDPAGYDVLMEAVQKEPTKDAAIEALGRLGNAKAIPVIRELLVRAERACGAQTAEDEPAPSVFARQHGSTIVACATALYRLGDADAVPRMVELYSRVRLFERIFANATKRRVAYTDLQGIGILKGIVEGEKKLAAMLAKLRAEAGPIPEQQSAAFVKAAGQAKDPVEVEWLCLAIEQSAASRPAATWQPLATAPDGIIRRMATALGNGK